MPDDVFNPDFWRGRLIFSDGELHRAIYRCSIEQWLVIEARHRAELAQHLRPTDSILDAGCGYGRLLDILPAEWDGRYVGVDLAQDFIHLARRRHPGKQFIVGNLLSLRAQRDCQRYDWVIAVSLRLMVKTNLGEAVWEQIESNLHHVANKILYLEYEATIPAEIVIC